MSVEIITKTEFKQLLIQDINDRMFFLSTSDYLVIGIAKYALLYSNKTIHNNIKMLKLTQQTSLVLQ